MEEFLISQRVRMRSPELTKRGIKPHTLYRFGCGQVVEGSYKGYLAFPCSGRDKKMYYGVISLVDDVVQVILPPAVSKRDFMFPQASILPPQKRWVSNPIDVLLESQRDLGIFAYCTSCSSRN